MLKNRSEHFSDKFIHCSSLIEIDIFDVQFWIQKNAFQPHNLYAHYKKKP